MFSKALSSFTSNISGNYTLSAHPTSSSGPWSIYDAKHKKTAKAASVFVFSPKTLEPSSGGLGRGGGAASLKRAHDEVVERLRREAASLARLRHPCILELQEPVEDTRNGGLMFATEPVTASLAGLLREKDEQEGSGGGRGRGSRYMVEESDGSRKRREVEIDELEIQKGLLQLGKGLEFLHESAGLVHANLTPDAVLVNAKGDWKIAGLAFCGPHESSTAATSLPPISLSEVLNNDPRLPTSVQLNLDYTSPDFVLDNQLTPSADMFSLGLLIVALYNTPHTSTLSTSGSLSTYKRLFSSSSSTPSPSNNFLVSRSHPLPPKLATDLLPRLLARRPAQRLSAKEFQEASYFNNILVSTLRFLDALPAKSAQEKAAFLRGLPRIAPQFPKSVLEKKVLPVLLEEMKDRDLVAAILSNIFAMVQILPTGKHSFETLVTPKLREVFLASRSAEKDAAKEAGLVVLLENMQVVADNCSGKEFRDNILPIILLALESPTPGLVDAALSTLPSVLPVLDFSTIKHDLFPSIAAVFAKTSSLAIKIRGLEAFYTLCGGSATTSNEMDGDDLNGVSITANKTTTSNSAILDKHTVQEKVIPLLKGIKTKEPGVMMAALQVLRQAGVMADSEYVAIEILPLLWRMSLGPLLDLKQFGTFMAVIKRLGAKVEQERTRQLRELGGSEGSGVRSARAAASSAGGAFGVTPGQDADFETLVSGRKPAASGNNGDLMNDFGGSNFGTTNTRPNALNSLSPRSNTDAAPTFSWQTTATSPQPLQPSVSALRAPAQHVGRSITPDQSLSGFATLTPASPFSQPLQPNRPLGSTNMPLRPAAHQLPPSINGNPGIDWSAATTNTATAWANQRPPQQRQSTANGFSAGGTGGFGLPPPPLASPQALGQIGGGGGGSGAFPGWTSPAQQQQRQQQISQSGGGLAKYESLL